MSESGAGYTPGEKLLGGSPKVKGSAGVPRKRAAAAIFMMASCLSYLLLASLHVSFYKNITHMLILSMLSQLMKQLLQ